MDQTMIRDPDPSDPAVIRTKYTLLQTPYPYLPFEARKVSQILLRCSSSTGMRLSQYDRVVHCSVIWNYQSFCTDDDNKCYLWANALCINQGEVEERSVLA